MVVPRTVLVLALVMAGEALCADASLTNEDVVRLANAGIGDDVIAAMVKAGSAPARDAAPPASGRTASESGEEPARAGPRPNDRGGARVPLPVRPLVDPDLTGIPCGRLG